MKAAKIFINNCVLINLKFCSKRGQCSVLSVKYLRFLFLTRKTHFGNFQDFIFALKLNN